MDQINFRPQGNFLATPQGAAPAASPTLAPQANGIQPASARVTNFAQTLAADGAAIKGMGADAMGGPGMGGAPMMIAPTLVQSGFDMDRAFQLTSTKLAAGRKDGTDLFAAAIAASSQLQSDE